MHPLYRRPGHDRGHRLAAGWVRNQLTVHHLVLHLDGSHPLHRDVLLPRFEHHRGRLDGSPAHPGAVRRPRLDAVSLGAVPRGAGYPSTTGGECSFPACSRKDCCLVGARLGAAFPALRQRGCFPAVELLVGEYPNLHQQLVYQHRSLQVLLRALGLPGPVRVPLAQPGLAFLPREGPSARRGSVRPSPASSWAPQQAWAA